MADMPSSCQAIRKKHVLLLDARTSGLVASRVSSGWATAFRLRYDGVRGQVYVGRDEAEVTRQTQTVACPLRQDEDVLDTLFSSGLWTYLHSRLAETDRPR